MRYYGLDLRDEFESAGCRRLWALVTGLPPNAATWGQDRWTQQDELLAGLIEMTDISSRRIVHALGGKMKDDPIQIERPGREAEALVTDRAEIAAWFALNR